MPLRKQPLFYSEVIGYLKEIFPPECGYDYGDNFDGDLYINGYNILRIIEIKSESEVAIVSTERGGDNPTFAELRNKIHSLRITQRPNGKYAGWLCYLAQLKDYLERMPADIEIQTFAEVELLFSIPYDRFCEFSDTLKKVEEAYNINAPINWKLINGNKNIIIMIFKKDSVEDFFQKILQVPEDN